MKKQTFRLVVLTIASFGWASLAAAQGQGGGMMRRPEGSGGQAGFGAGRGEAPVDRIAEHLGLSAEQKAQWKTIHENARETGEPLMKAARTAKEAFDKALESEVADAATIGHAAIALRNAQREVKAQHEATQHAVKATLTPDQLAKMEAAIPRRVGPEGSKPRGPQGQERRPMNRPDGSR